MSLPPVRICCIIATYGDLSWRDRAQRALASAQGQGFDQIICHHDAAPDGGSLANSRNAGASLASDWILFLDADDELAPGFGDAMRAAQRPDQPHWLYTPAVQYIRGTARPAPKIWPRVDLDTGNWCVIGTLIHRDVFVAAGGFRDYGMYEDWALWAMAEQACGAQVVEVPDAVYVAHVQQGSRNRQPARAEKLYWHQRIGHDIWPAKYAAPTVGEDKARRLATSRLRFVA